MRATFGLANTQAAQAQGVATAPTVPAAPPLAIVTPGQLADIRARRSEISSQIGNITSRREEIASQLRSAIPGADRAGLEGRLAVLDARIATLESDLESTGRELILARGAVAGTTTDDPPGPQNSMPNSDQMTGIIIVFTLAVLMPLSIAWARGFLRRSKHASEQPSRELTQKLNRMEEGIEAIAIEVERISEGQRFVTKVIGQGAAQPVAVGRGDAVPVERT